MAKDVKVVINLKQPTGKVGFGYPLIFAGVAETAVEYTECSRLADVVTAGFTEGTAVHTAAKRIFEQTDAPAKIAVCATAENAVTGLATILTKGWRQLIIASAGTEGESTIEEIGAFIETTPDKMYFASVTDLSEVTANMEKLTRTCVMYYTNAEVICPEAALVGKVAGLAAGSVTYDHKILKGLEPLEFSVSELEAIHKKNCYTFVTMAGDNVTTDGKVLSGEWIDIIDSKDYIIFQMEYQLQKILNTTNKVTYDNNGISLLENVCVNVLQDAYNNNIIADNAEGTAAYTVDFKPRSETTAEDRKVRRYVGGSFAFSLRGAIHEVEVTGEIEV